MRYLKSSTSDKILKTIFFFLNSFSTQVILKGGFKDERSFAGSWDIQWVKQQLDAQTADFPEAPQVK